MKADERIRKRILEKDATKNTYKLYKPGKKVFIRLRGKGKDSLKKHRVLIGRILKRYKDDTTYLVKVKILGEAEPSVQKVWIENIANNSRLPKQNQSKQAKRKDSNYFRIPLTRISYIEELTKQGYVVTHDPLVDGNCQPVALSYALRELGIYRSSETLRVKVVQFIEEHDMVDGIVVGNEATWTYLNLGQNFKKTKFKKLRILNYVLGSNLS